MGALQRRPAWQRIAGVHSVFTERAHARMCVCAWPSVSSPPPQARNPHHSPSEEAAAVHARVHCITLTRPPHG
eukprot:scaffold37516_cov31-Tisochrysis_lutea.AAC.1